MGDDIELIPEDEHGDREAQDQRDRIAMGIEEPEEDWEPRREDWDDLNNFL